MTNKYFLKDSSLKLIWRMHLNLLKCWISGHKAIFSSFLHFWHFLPSLSKHIKKTWKLYQNCITVLLTPCVSLQFKGLLNLWRCGTVTNTNFYHFLTLLSMQITPQHDITEEEKLWQPKPIFNVVSKYVIAFCIAFLEIEKQLPSFAELLTKKNFLNFWRPLVIMAIPKSNFHIAYLRITSLATIFWPNFLAWTPEQKKLILWRLGHPA